MRPVSRLVGRRRWSAALCACVLLAGLVLLLRPGRRAPPDNSSSRRAPPDNPSSRRSLPDNPSSRRAPPDNSSSRRALPDNSSSRRAPPDNPSSRRLRALPVINSEEYAALQSPAACADDTRLLLLVTSAPGHWRQRQAIRDTWGSAPALRPLRARLLFLLGTSGAAQTKQVNTEVDLHVDILLGDFVDTYRNLTLKTVTGLRWAARDCAGVDYVVKTDDDIYWNLPLLTSHLEGLNETRVITGCIKQYAAPRPAGPAGLRPPSGHPLFAAGAGYVLSGGLLADLVAAARRLPLLPVEDVFVTGYCARLAGAWPPRHHPGFSCGGALVDDCDLVDLFNGHRISPARQYLIWERFTSEPNPCMDF